MTLVRTQRIHEIMSEELESSSTETNESSEAESTEDEELYVADEVVNAYQDEPLAMPGENESQI